MPAIFLGGAGGECISLKCKDSWLQAQDWIFDMFNLLVALHVLLAAKSLSTNIAVVKGGCVASLGENCGYFHILHRGTWRVDQKFPQKLLVTGHFQILHRGTWRTRYNKLPHEWEGCKVLKRNDRTTGSRMTPPWVEPGRNDYMERLTRQIYIHKLCLFVSTKRNIGMSALICRSTWGGSKKLAKLRRCKSQV